jgi:hypothetical protein
MAAGDYELDINPRNREELMRRDREFRNAIAQMSKAQRSTLLETLQQLTGYTKGHLQRCMDIRPREQQKQFRTLFSYSNKPAPSGISVPKGASPKDVMFNLKLRIGEATVRAVQSGESANREIKQGVKYGEATKDFGNSVTGLNTGKMSRYLLNDRMYKANLEGKLYFQNGGGVYFQYWHDSPRSSGSESEDQEAESFAFDIYDLNDDLYGN